MFGLACGIEVVACTCTTSQLVFCGVGAQVALFTEPVEQRTYGLTGTTYRLAE